MRHEYCTFTGMKQYIFLLASVLFFSSLEAQIPYYQSATELVTPATRSYTLKASYTGTDDIMTRFTANHAILSDPSYTLIPYKTVESLTGKHYTFQVAKDGYLIYNAQVKIHTSPTGEVFKVNDNTPQISNTSSINQRQGKYMWIQTQQGWSLASVEESATDHSSMIIKSEDGIEHQVDNKLFFRAPDSLVHAHVFMVNPLNTAKRTYGSPYIDSNDLDVPQVNAERKWATMKAHFENDTFRLKNDRYYFGHVSDPVTPETYALSDTFDFTRSQYQFEDVNAFYHITAMSDYMTKLGFESALPDTLLIDAHGYNGADASSFNYGVTPVELEFGEGGVDDAEDGEIVVHEFAHALAYFAGGDSYSDTRDRAAMEEGNADYFSASYSKSYTDFGWQEMFNWDGHNPFWGGIHIGTILTYPKDMLNSTNEDREMWSTPLMCIYDKIGRGAADSLVMEHLYYQYKNATITEMAEILLDIDSMLWDGKYEHEIRSCFAKHDILAGVAPSPVFAQYFNAYGTAGFSTGETNAEIRAKDNQPFSYLVYNALGQTTLEGTTQNSLILDPQTFISGIYFVELKKDGISAYLKVIKN